MPFTFDPSTGRYRDQVGRVIPDSAIRKALDSVLSAQAQSTRDLTQRMMAGSLSLGEWQQAMMQNIKTSHLIGLATSNGGWKNLDQSDFGWVGQRIRSQYGYLRDFAADLQSGRQPMNNTVMVRATMYVDAGRQTHRAAQRRAAEKRGLKQERNQLGAADHCAGCLNETSKGWVPIGTLVPCGSRNCMSRCHCTLLYRNTAA